MPAMRVFCAVLACLCASCAPNAPPPAERSFHEQAVAESLKPIHPMGDKPSWNKEAKQFIWAPAFGLHEIEGAKAYRVTLLATDRQARSFEAEIPWAALTPIWKDVPVGGAFLQVLALNRAGGDGIAVVRTRSFHRAAVFNGPYGHAVLP